MHVFADLQPYICTFEPCEKKLIKFPTRKLWAEHEFSEHRVLRSWCCPECTDIFSAAHDLEAHLKLSHRKTFALTRISVVLSTAERREAVPINTQECPLCKKLPGKSQRNFVTHVGRHLEAIALAILPRDTEEDSEEASVVSSDGSEPVKPNANNVGHAEEVKDYEKSGLLMGALPCEHEGCGHVSWSVTDHT